MKIGVIGCGRFGSCLAASLARKGIDVIAMDQDPHVVSRMSGDVARMVEGDATDEDALKEAGFAECDAVVIAIGDNMEGSILTAMSLKEMNVRRIFAKAVSDIHGKVLQRIGVDRVLYPDRDMAVRTARLLLTPTILDYVEVSDEAGVIDIPAPARLVGKTVAETEMRKLHGVLMLAIEKTTKPGGQRRTILVPGPAEVIEDKDVLVLFGPNSKLKRIESDMSG